MGQRRQNNRPRLSGGRGRQGSQNRAAVAHENFFEPVPQAAGDDPID